MGKTLITKSKKAYVFDFDDVLAKTEARIRVHSSDGTKYLTSKEFSEYVVREGETLDFTEFRDPEFIRSARVMPLFDVVRNIGRAIGDGRSTSVMYVLTAREDGLRRELHRFFTRNGVNEMKYGNIITVGSVPDISSADAKRNVLKRLLKKGMDIVFFDDDIKNIEIAKKLVGIKTRHIDDDDI
jgi:hypothetical protein